jgi:hypothetical protein
LSCVAREKPGKNIHTKFFTSKVRKYAYVNVAG